MGAWRSDTERGIPAAEHAVANTFSAELMSEAEQPVDCAHDSVPLRKEEDVQIQLMDISLKRRM